MLQVMQRTFCIGSVQSEQDESKMARKEVEELQRVRETHTKQLQFLSDTRHELEQKTNAMHAENNVLKNGLYVIQCSMQILQVGGVW